MNPAASSSSSSSMVNSEQKPEVDQVQEEEDFDDSSTEEIIGTDHEDEDDSDEDPTFDIREETCRSLSKLSLKKSKSRIIPKVIDFDNQGELEEDDVKTTIKVVPMELDDDDDDDESDSKGFDKVEKKLIQAAGQLEKLKVEECKIYLRKHGLRLTGNKDVLIQRIREHLEIINGGGEHKYPVSSFVLNCKGDACTGDIVMFEQNVYEMFSIASRSATGPPCGTRVIAGRIVKESYGAAKQQHTFTIEVLWSKGVKPLPPLHPLLIKGRNLYRLQTMRQRWDDEEKRRQVLLEKHSRGASARSNRETRIQVKEMRKTLRGQRGTGTAQEQRRQPRSDTLKTNIQFQTQQPFVAPVMLNQWPTQFTQQKPAAPPNTIPVVTEICQQNVSRLQPNLIQPPNRNVIEQKTWGSENSNGVEHRNSGFTAVENHRRNGFHPVAKMQHCYPSKDHRSHDGLQGGNNHGASNGSLHKQPSILSSPPRSPMHHLSRNDDGFNVQRCLNENGKFPQRQPLTSLSSPPRSPLHRSPMHHLSRNDHGFNAQRYSNENGKFPQRQPLTSLRSPPRSPLHRSPMHHLSRNDHGFNVRKCSNENGNFPQRQPLTSLNSHPPPPRSPIHRWGRPMERQVCRYYPLGRCHYGDNCKFAHENGDRREHRLPNNQPYYGYH